MLEEFCFCLYLFPVILLFFPKAHTNTKQQIAHAVTPTPKALSLKKVKPTPAPKKQSEETLVYGAWTSQTSVIRAVDLGTSAITTLAILPLTIKKV